MTLMTAVRLQRTIPAAPDEVYRAWLDPELLRRRGRKQRPSDDGAVVERQLHP